MYDVLERVHPRGIKQQHVAHPDYQHFGFSGDPSQSVFESFRRAEEKGTVDLVDLDTRRNSAQTRTILIRHVSIDSVLLEFLLQSPHVGYLSHPLHEKEGSQYHSDADRDSEID